jgi:hypothetical protein
MRRAYGSGHLYVKSGAYYVRWRASDGRQLNRRVGAVRTRGASDGLTRAQAERAARRLIEAQAAHRPSEPTRRSPTVDEVAGELRDRIALEGARLSYRQNCESMQRIHISPAIGKRRAESITRKELRACCDAVRPGRRAALGRS